jgi:hypothetical protein
MVIAMVEVGRDAAVVIELMVMFFIDDLRLPRAPTTALTSNDDAD